MWFSNEGVNFNGNGVSKKISNRNFTIGKCYGVFLLSFIKLVTKFHKVSTEVTSLTYS